MKFSLTRRINLETISARYAFQFEEVTVSDADSFEEAKEQLDLAVIKRLDKFKQEAEISDSIDESKLQTPELVQPAPTEEAPSRPAPEFLAPDPRSSAAPLPPVPPPSFNAPPADNHPQIPQFNSPAPVAPVQQQQGINSGPPEKFA